MNSQDLLLLLKNEIPISKSIGIHSLNISDESLSLALPILPNKNHKGTLFGGSLYSSAALASYGLFLTELNKQGFTTNNIVISDGEMKYKKPVNKDALVEASWPSISEKNDFINTLRKKGKARITIRCTISCDNIICAEFLGKFVAVL